MFAFLLAFSEAFWKQDDEDTRTPLLAGRLDWCIATGGHEFAPPSLMLDLAYPSPHGSVM
jgi:hypothetical protein